LRRKIVPYDPHRFSARASAPEKNLKFG
jgi:hypothetical protein